MKRAIAVITLLLGLTSLFAQTPELSRSVNKNTPDLDSHFCYKIAD